MPPGNATCARAATASSSRARVTWSWFPSTSPTFAATGIERAGFGRCGGGTGDSRLRSRHCANPYDRGPVRPEGDGHQVDPIRGRTQPSDCLAHPSTLLLGQLHDRILTDSGLDLDGDEAPLQGGDQIDLTATGTQIAGEDPRPASGEEGGGDGLAEGA